MPNTARSHIERALLTAPRGLALALLAIPVSLALFILMTVSLSLIGVGTGILLIPAVTVWMRGYANLRRRLAYEWYGVEVKEPYRPTPDYGGGPFGWAQRCLWILRDPATWRDLLWTLVDATIGFTLAVLCIGLFAQGLFGFVLAAGVWKPIADAGDGYWYAFIHVTDQADAYRAAMLGAVEILLALWLNPKIMTAHAKLTRLFLAPSRERTLAMRVEHLTETRSDALDTQAAELRRIERDLHDGAQARLVAMGMSLGAIEHLMEHDPDRAKRLVAEARASSAEALNELRDLVRGIHPPVLAERGLGDAVRALALKSPLPVEVAVELPGRLDSPVESAAYFAISEVLTNTAKHSGATRVWIDLRHAGGTLHMNVTDDGHGGADASGGTGLHGIERRLDTFDGVMAVNSPQGGPTMVMMELPCALSSPKTSSS